MKINSRMHGGIDYAVVVFLALSPTLFGLAPTTTTFTYILAGIHSLLTVFTRFEWGIVRVIPFRVHGGIELIVSVALVAIALRLGKIDGDISEYFYLSFAIAVFLIWLLTDYKPKKGSLKH